jgi:gamma-carbonic anhydrase
MPVSIATSLYTLPYDGAVPKFAVGLACASGASVLGRADIGPWAQLGPFSVIRADGEMVRVGSDFSFGEKATIHIMGGMYPTLIADGVTVGRNAVVHACTLGSRCVVGNDAIVLDGSVIEDDVLVEAGAVVFMRSRLESGFVYAGLPAKQVRPLRPSELEERARALREETWKAITSAAAAAPTDPSGWPSAFVARTATMSGPIVLEAQSSVFFSCMLDARSHGIEIGVNTNIQDNSCIRAAHAPCVIGADTSFGHNVRAEDCRVGDNCLIGIGSTLQCGTTVEDDVFLAAGAVTDPGQALESGWLWGGNPARALSKLDDRKRALIRMTVAGYRQYGAAYKQAQES